MGYFLFIFFITIVVLLFHLYNYWVRCKKYEEKYSHLIKIDDFLETRKKEITIAKEEIVQLKEEYKEKSKIFNKLTEQIEIYDDEVILINLGFYKKHYDFDSSERYKIQMNKVREEQKKLLKSGSAITCGMDWEVGNSLTEGRRMVKRSIKLTSRAFNNECDSIMSNVRWNNVDRMEIRIKKSFEMINKLNEPISIVISREYLNLKLKELWLTHEYEEKKQEEKEIQRKLKQQIREEAKLEQEYENSIKKENKFKKLLKKAQEKAEKISGDELNILKQQIVELENKLRDSRLKSERAKSMAEQTKSGHVYIISNIGSFGDNIYKIGMTRRLEPFERVKELSDASVPFVFDVHAMITSHNAPALESSLHKVFDKRRVNLVNYRKEYFNVTLGEIKEEVDKLCPEAEFTEYPEAKEYRQTCSITNQIKQSKNDAVFTNKFPREL